MTGWASAATPARRATASMPQRCRQWMSSASRACWARLSRPRTWPFLKSFGDTIRFGDYSPRPCRHPPGRPHRATAATRSALDPPAVPGRTGTTTASWSIHGHTISDGVERRGQPDRNRHRRVPHRRADRGSVRGEQHPLPGDGWLGTRVAIREGLTVGVQPCIGMVQFGCKAMA